MATVKYPITREGLEAKEARLAEVERQLFQVLPPMICSARRQESVTKENSGWQDLQRAKSELESERDGLIEFIGSAVVIQGAAPKAVDFGHRVVLESQRKKRFEVQVVPPAEADLAASKISNISPLGTAIFGRRKGECVKCQTPSGQQAFKILAISA